MLEIRQITKRFGGVQANADISLALKPQQIHALIGPNGAGKSTLIAQIAGEISPDHGQVLLNGVDVSNCSVEHRNHLGLGRMFQTTSLFAEMSVLDNIRIPLLQRGPATSRWKWFSSAVEKDNDMRKKALRLLETLGIDHHPDQLVNTLSHGEQRQLEMTVTLATEPECLLLDEPMAGMSSEESTRMILLIRRLRQDHTILLVEHDMQAVFDLADTISVLVEGQIIASGSVDEIRNNEAVQSAYLGARDAKA